MARILVFADDHRDRRVELIHVDPAEDGWDGDCSACPWTIEGERGFFPNKQDAVAMAEVHVDLPH